MKQTVPGGKSKWEDSDLVDRANQTGNSEMVLEVLKRIHHRLESEPTVFGEPRYGLHALDVAVRIATLIPLFVGYAVHNSSPLVFVQEFHAMTGHRLEER